MGLPVGEADKQDEGVVRKNGGQDGGQICAPSKADAGETGWGSLGGKEKTYTAGRTRNHLGCSGCQAGDIAEHGCPLLDTL